MTDPAKEQLLGYLLDALEDDEQEVISKRLDDEPQLREELAAVGRLLGPINAARYDYCPPPGLAERTSRLVAGCAQSTPTPRRRAMHVETAPAGSRSGLRWHEIAVAACVFIMAGLLTIPAIQSSRFNAQLAACQDNLREAGRAMTQYSERHAGLFPSLLVKNRFVSPQAYAKPLLDGGYLTDVDRVICPGSPLADQGDYEVAEQGSPIRTSYSCSFGYNDNGKYRDTRNLHREQFAVLGDAPDPDAPDYQSFNHGHKGQNFWFEDGHVRFLPSPHPEKDDFYLNDAGQFAPGIHRDDSVIAPSSTMPVIYVNGSW